jgi:hypothetical protein
MRSIVLLVGAAAIIVAGICGAAADGKIRLAQSGAVTACMMACNAQAANCQTACLVPGTPPTTAATTTSNATASTACILNCSSTQLACQTICSRQSPSQ